MLSDTPIPPTVRVRGFSHLLGECGVAIFAAPKLAAARRRGFPASLEGAPFLLPVEPTSLRRALDSWLEARGMRVEVVGEFEDSALLKVFGQAGRGLFAGPAAIERELCTQYGVRVVGRIPEVRERFYAISPERRIRHPAVVAITEAAHDRLFA